MASVSIIIQGPLNPVSLGNIGQYKKFGEVIIACWSNDNLDLLAQHRDVKTAAVTPFDASQYSNPQNLLFQAVTTVTGLKAASGDICIKVRSDEYYSNLAPVIAQLEKTPDKVVCDNMYFRTNWRMHVSDHLLAARRPLMIEAFDQMIGKLTRPGGQYRGVPPETIVATTFVQCRGGHVQDVQPHPYIGPGHPDCRPNNAEEKMLLKNTFEIAPIRTLAPFLVKVLMPSPDQSKKHHVHIGYEDQQLFMAGGYRNIFNSVDEL